MTIENLYSFVFWFNPYENLWYAIERDSYLQFFNGSREQAKFYSSKQQEALMDLITKDSLKKFR